MSGKNLTFKLVMDADTKDYVSNTKQAQDVTVKVFGEIKREAEEVRKASAAISKELENLVPKGTKELVESLNQSLTKATEIINGAGEHASEAANNFTDFGRKSEKAIDVVKSDLTEAKKKLQEFANTKATPADIDRAQVEVDQLEKEVQQADQALDGFNGAVADAGNRVETSSTKVETLSKGFGAAKFAVTALVGAMGALGVGLGLRELAQAADTYTNLSARINIATREGGNFNQAMAGVHQVALATNSSLDATGDLFTRINTISKDMGMSQQQALDLTKTITQAIQIGGGSAQASEAAVQQFIQAMQGGVLRGEEFNSIMENGYGLAEALAKGLGVTTGELRKMAENGELSSERVIKAIQSQAGAIQETYNQFPTTISNALQKIATSWQILIGEMDQVNGASATVAQWLSTLADNLNVVEVLLNDIGSGFVWFGDQLKKIDLATIEALKTALLSAYDAAKSLVESAGSMIGTTAQVLDTALSSIFNFNSGIDSAEDKTNGLTKALQTASVVFAVFNDGFKGIAIVVNLFAGAMYEATGAFMYWKSKFMFGDAKEAAFKEFQDLTERAKQLYKQADDLAMNHEVQVIKALDNIGKTRKQKDSESIESAKATMEQILAAKQTEATNSKKLESDKLAAVQAYAEAAIKANGGVMDGTMQADLMTKGYIVTLDQSGKVAVQAGLSAEQAAENAAKKEEALKLAKENVQKADEALLEFQKKSAIERALLDAQILKAKQSGDLTELKSAQDKLTAIDTRETELTIARNTRAEEYNRINTGSGQIAENAYSRASTAAAALGVNLDASLNRISKSFAESGAGVTELGNKLAQAGITGKQAGDVTYEAWLKWLETAKSQAEIDVAKAKLQEFGDQGKISTGQVESGLIAVKMQAQELPDDIDPVTESFKRLGIETKENLKLAAQRAVMDFINIRDSGKATAEGVQKAYEKMTGIVAASGDAGVIAAANAAGANQDLRIEVDSTGKASVKSMDDLTSANKRVGDSARSAISGYRELGDAARQEAKSSIEAWNEMMDARSKAEKENKEQRVGADFTTYNLMDIQSKLTSMGFDDAEAAKLAKNILNKGLEVDRGKAMDARARGDEYTAKAFEKLLNNGQTSAFGTKKVEELLARYMAGQGSAKSGTKSAAVNALAPEVNVAVPTATVEQAKERVVQNNITINGRTISVPVTESNQGNFDEFLSELEQLKRAM